MEINTSVYYTRPNLELVLGSKKRTLDARLKALEKKGVIVPLKRGFYLNNQLYQKTLDKQVLLEFIGGKLVTPSYISLEYALASYGFLAEEVYAITSITSKKTRTFQTPVASFVYRNLKSELFNAYEVRYFEGLPYYYATPTKALFDFLYLTPMNSVTQVNQVLTESRINWGVLTREMINHFAELVANSGSSKMKKILTQMKRLGVL